jgi:hypothetical protein
MWTIVKPLIWGLGNVGAKMLYAKGYTGVAAGLTLVRFSAHHKRLL